MPGGGKIGHQEVGQHGADIETHRAVEREFGVDHPRLAARDHDRAGVQVAVEQRLGARHELQLQPGDRDVEVHILAKLCGERIEIRRSPAVLLGDAVRIGEDQILGDLAQRMVAGESCDALLLLGRRHREVGGEEQCPRHEGGDVIDKARILRARNHPLAHDDVGLEQLHHRQRQGLVVMQQRRHEAGRELGLPRQSEIFVMSPGQRQRPALADEADIGQRLLHGDAAAAALDDENEIEIAVADFGDRPGGRLAAEGRGEIRNAREIVPQRRLMQNPVVPLPLRHDDPIPCLAWPNRYSRSRKLEPISAFLLIGS